MVNFRLSLSRPLKIVLVYAIALFTGFGTQVVQAQSSDQKSLPMALKETELETFDGSARIGRIIKRGEFVFIIEKRGDRCHVVVRTAKGWVDCDVLSKDHND